MAHDRQGRREGDRAREALTSSRMTTEWPATGSPAISVWLGNEEVPQ
jgi:hypothetical protein